MPDKIPQSLRDELRDQNDFLDRLVPLPALKPVASSTPTHPFVDALMTIPDVQTANGDVGVFSSRLSDQTENERQPSFSSTGDALVDLFTMSEQADGPSLHRLLDAAWNQDPLKTLKAICQARSIPQGKGAKQDSFYNSISWLWRKHPRTLLENLEQLFVAPVNERPDLLVKKGEEVQVLKRAPIPHGNWNDLCVPLSSLGK